MTDHATMLSRADMCELLGCFVSLPTSELVSGLREGSYATDVADVMAELGIESREVEEARALFESELAGMDDEEALRALRNDYAALFTVPKRNLVPLYESIFLAQADGAETKPVYFVNGVARDIEELYHKAGLKSSHALGANLSLLVLRSSPCPARTKSRPVRSRAPFSCAATSRVGFLRIPGALLCARPSRMRPFLTRQTSQYGTARTTRHGLASQLVAYHMPLPRAFSSACRAR